MIWATVLFFLLGLKILVNSILYKIKRDKNELIPNITIGKAVGFGVYTAAQQGIFTDIIRGLMKKWKLDK